jgi:hypothetical protein
LASKTGGFGNTEKVQRRSRTDEMMSIDEIGLGIRRQTDQRSGFLVFVSEGRRVSLLFLAGEP